MTGGDGADGGGSPVGAAVAALEVRDVTKRFGGRLAVDGVSFSVPEGEIFGLLGHNGAGKSTLIGMLLGQVWPTAGQLRIAGHDVGRSRQAALARVGAIFESPVFYDYLSGWRNLQILSRYTAETPAARLREVIEWVGLSGRERALVRTYSHGMRARLALAQALLPDPRLLILDEPGDGLDPGGIAELRQTILRLRREKGLTIVLSSHLLAEVEQVCSRIVVLNRGRKVHDGPLAGAGGVRRPRYRLVTVDFVRAVAGLEEAGLAAGEAARNPAAAGADAIAGAGPGAREGAGTGHLRLRDGVTSDRVVAWLVSAGHRVHEFARDEESLEDLYLRLMEPRVEGRAA